MSSAIDYLAYCVVAAIFLMQLIPEKNTDKKNGLFPLKAALFLFFLSTDFSRSFFPLFSSHFQVEHLDKPMQMALPQIVWGLSALIATPYGYRLSGKLGAPKVLARAALFTALATIVMGSTSNYWIMLLCRSVIAGAYGTIAIVGTLYLNSIGKASAIAILLTAIASASIAGNAIGGLAAQFFGHSNTILISSIFAIASSALLIAFFKPDTAHEISKNKAPTLRHLLASKRIQAFALLNTAPFRIVLTGFVLYLIPVLLADYHINLKTTGQLMMLYFLVNWLLISPFSRILDRHELYKASAILSSILMAMGLILFYYSNGDILFITISIFILSTGMTLNSVIQTPIIPVIFQKECQDYGENTVIAYFRTVERIGSVIGPLAASLLLSAVGAQVVRVTGALLLLVGLGLLAFFALDQRLAKSLARQENAIAAKQVSRETA